MGRSALARGGNCASLKNANAPKTWTPNATRTSLHVSCLRLVCHAHDHTPQKSYGFVTADTSPFSYDPGWSLIVSNATWTRFPARRTCQFRAMSASQGSISAGTLPPSLRTYLHLHHDLLDAGRDVAIAFSVRFT